ncbi:hypothetical protein O181_044173 [Austropuccinia psidii MF-1]|uniref:Uncharacterized protein n=1 Tax=Austropuccinia psidii MF-1 TaxID=1389203 RepID=A0A9Q3HGE1_9BASI|nr:hypothetical protein [Austropuccinia psidii MF-1]
MQGKKSLLYHMENLFATKLQSQHVFFLRDSEKKRDCHLILGHPSDEYTKQLLSRKRITATFTSSSEFQVCLHAKIKRLPHFQHLPSTHSPFTKIHIAMC